MKTKYLFEVMELDEELVAVPVGGNTDQFHGVLKVNETAAAILKLLEQDITEAQIVETMMQQYTGNKESIANYVHIYLEKLKEEGIVE